MSHPTTILVLTEGGGVGRRCYYTPELTAKTLSQLFDWGCLNHVGFGDHLKESRHGQVRWTKRKKSDSYGDSITQIRLEGNGHSIYDLIEIKKWNDGVGTSPRCSSSDAHYRLRQQ